jgi:phage terminase large subunit
MFKRPASYFLTRFHEKQETAWLAYKAGLTVVLPWGRRSGKSEYFAEVLIEDVENYGKPCLYLASTQDSAREIMWPKMRERVQKLPDWKLSDSILEAVYKPTNTPIRFRGIEKVDNLAGKAYRIVVADEFALWKKDPKTIVKQILAPMIADYDGLLMYGSSKRGKNHLYDLHKTALDNTNKYYVDDCTIFDNPFVSEAGREKLLSEYSGVDDPLYRQEVLNEYVTFAGMVFALDQSMYVTEKWDEAELYHAVHWRGVDHGFSPDPTACLWMSYNHRKGYFLIYNEYKQSKLLIHQHSEIIQKTENYDFRETISDIDPQIIAEYDAIGLTMTPAGKYDKQARLLRLVNMLRTGKLKIAKNCTELLKEMASYEWDQDGNDHLIDAMIYVVTNTEIPEKPLPEPIIEPTRSNMDNFVQDFG